MSAPPPTAGTLSPRSGAPHSDSADDLSTIELVRHPCPQNEDDAATWTQVLITKPTLATFTKRVAHKGFALKRGPTSRNMWNWTRVFLLLQYPFLSYFASNDPATRCLGLVYVAPVCVIRTLPHYPGRKHVLQIKPSVRRNLHHKSVEDDEDNFYFSFENEEMCAQWKAELMSEIARGVQEAQDVEGLNDDDVVLQPMSLHSMDLKDAASALKALDNGPKDRVQKAAALMMLDGVPDLVSDDGGDRGDDRGAGGQQRRQPDELDSLASVSDDSNEPPPGSPPKRSTSKLFGATKKVELPSDEDDDVSNVGSTASRSHKSSILPRYTESNTRRRSFFAADDLIDCFNSEAVHRTHCTRCKISPVVGFLYTCAVCEQTCELCASCFRVEDHDIRHLFLVSPDIEGECLRVLPALESGPFRIAELILFEALFRIVGSDFDGQPTKPMSKRRLLAFWNSVATSGQGGGAGGITIGALPPQLLLSEKDLTMLCRDPDLVTFQEFMFLVRCKLASQASYCYLNAAWRLPASMKDRGSGSGTSPALSSASSVSVMQATSTTTFPPLELLPPEGSFVYIALAFSLVNRMMQSYRHGLEGNGGGGGGSDDEDVRETSSTTSKSSDAAAKVSPLLRPYEEALVASGRKATGRATSSRRHNETVDKSGLSAVSQIEEATLQMLLGACSVVPLAASEEMIPVTLYTQLLRCMHLVAARVASSSMGEVAISVVGDDVILAQVAEDFPPNGGWLVEDDEELLPATEVYQKAVARWKAVTAQYTLKRQQRRQDTSSAATAFFTGNGSHYLVDAVEHVLSYEVGGALGLYTDQPESIHCEVCDSCNATPIVGFMYVEVKPGSNQAGRSSSTGSIPTKGPQGDDNDEDDCLHFCQACMSGKKWMAAAAASLWLTPTQLTPPRSSGALRSTLSNVSASSLHTTISPVNPAAPLPPPTIQIKRVPGEVVATYDRATGNVSATSNSTSLTSKKRHSR